LVDGFDLISATNLHSGLKENSFPVSGHIVRVHKVFFSWPMFRHSLIFQLPVK
jgi:hypothetical protein